MIETSYTNNFNISEIDISRGIFRFAFVVERIYSFVLATGDSGYHTMRYARTQVRTYRALLPSMDPNPPFLFYIAYPHWTLVIRHLGP